MAHALAEPLTRGELIVNLRAEAAPEFLKEATEAALQAVTRAARVSAQIEHLEAFRPGRPTPTHRLARI